jgi:hypothetical protein
LEFFIRDSRGAPIKGALIAALIAHRARAALPVHDGHGREYRCTVLDAGTRDIVLLWGMGPDGVFETADDEYGISVDEHADLSVMIPDEDRRRMWIEVLGREPPPRSSPR